MSCSHHSRLLLIILSYVLFANGMPTNKSLRNEKKNLIADKEVIEGDMVVDDRVNNDVQYAALTNVSHKWENGIIPFTFSDSYWYKLTYYAKSQVLRGMDYLETKTCIRFVPRTYEKDYLEIVESTGCWSYVGKRGGEQRLSIGVGCENRHIVVHELLHALGFIHEQSRKDRDHYVTINWNNIISGKERNFDKYTKTMGIDEISTLDSPYDKQSVMHYRRFGFTRKTYRDSDDNYIIDKDLMTIYSKSDYKEALGNKNGLSKNDIKRLNKHYNCGKKSKPKTTAIPSSTTTTKQTKTTTKLTTTTTTPSTTTTTPKTATTTTTKTTTTPTTTTTKPTTKTTTITTTTTKPTITTTTQTTTNSNRIISGGFQSFISGLILIAWLI